ncbi:hypothetical protein N9K82_05270 [Gammaproteobacteria bacterium]|jgi:hypothetical protein|nr:hypothetical protein [Gammaproteobacteria bacterium]
MNKSKSIKNILLTLMVFGSFGVFAEMKSLNKYIASEGQLDTPEVLYINYRCMGLIGMINNMTTGKTDKFSQILAPLGEESGQQFLKVTYPIWASVQKDSSIELFLKEIKNTVRPLGENYLKIANKNWATNGDYFKGNDLIIEDLSLCGAWLKMAQQGL